MTHSGKPLYRGFLDLYLLDTAIQVSPKIVISKILSTKLKEGDLFLIEFSVAGKEVSFSNKTNSIATVALNFKNHKNLFIANKSVHVTIKIADALEEIKIPLDCIVRFVDVKNKMIISINNDHMHTSNESGKILSR